MTRVWPRRTPTELQHWETLETSEVSAHLADLASGYVETEQKSRDALDTRLTAIIAFSGALLTLAAATGRAAAEASLSGTSRTVITAAFAAAVTLLAVSVMRCLWAIAPTSQPTPNTDLLLHYAKQATPDTEVRTDLFRLHGARLEAMAVANRRRATAVRDALALVALALLCSAVAAITIYFASV